MAKLDDSNTTGFYTELIACTSANGFESGKNYTVYISATVDSDTGGIAYTFNAMNQIMHKDSNETYSAATDSLEAIRDTLSSSSITTVAAVSGSTVTVDVKLRDGRIDQFGQDVKACALGQAAAAVVGAAVIGTTRAQIEAARDQLKAMLKQDGPVPDAPFDGLEVLIPARDYKNRHASILLTLEATAEALEQAERANCA